MEIAEIRGKVKQIQDFHSGRLMEQSTDQKFYDDKFPVGISSPFHITRTGTAARIVDSVVDHLELAIPQVTREPKKSGDKAKESALKVSRFLNHLIQVWYPEIAEMFKNGALRGEFIGLVQYNDEFTNKLDNGVPILFSAPDPMNVFCYPSDVIIPSIAFKSFNIKAMAVKEQAPDWVGDLTSGDVKYLAWWDNESRYIEAGESPISENTNYLGFVPIVHGYSGFGKKASDGDPASQAVGLLRHIRNLLISECEISSRIDSIIALYANPIEMIEQIVNGAEWADVEDIKNQPLAPGFVRVTPFGWKDTIYTPVVDVSQLFGYLMNIKQSLALYNPPIMQGISTPDTTGRLADIQYEHISKKPAKLVRSVELALAEALGMALRILEKTPGALPVTVRATTFKDGSTFRTEENITAEDIDGYYDCIVKLTPDKEIENDRLVMLGRILKNEGLISWQRFLTEYKGMTETEAMDEIAATIAETAIASNPTMLQMQVTKAMESIGATDYLNALKQQNAEAPKVQQAASTFRPSESSNPTSAQAVRQVLGESLAVRNPPNPQAQVSK